MRAADCVMSAFFHIDPPRFAAVLRLRQRYVVRSHAYADAASMPLTLSCFFAIHADAAITPLLTMPHTLLMLTPLMPPVCQSHYY